MPVERRGVAEVIECAQPQDVECGQSFVDPADGVVAAESVEDLSEDHVGECYASVGVDKSEPARRRVACRCDRRRSRPKRWCRRRSQSSAAAGLVEVTGPVDGAEKLTDLLKSTVSAFMGHVVWRVASGC